MKLPDRIRTRRIELNLTQAELAQKMGYKSRSSINKIELGISDITQSKIVEFAKVLDCSPEYLMGWEEEPPRQETTITDLSKYGIKQIKTKKFPMLGKIACGKPIFAEQDYETYIEASANIKADFCLTASGDSMINARIFDGDIVFIHSQPDVENGEIAAVIINDEATLKRVYKYENRIELRPENPTHQSMNYENEDINNITILGKAVAFQSYVR